MSNNYAFGGDPLRYQVRLLATGVSAGAIEALLSASVDCSIVSVSRAPLASAELYDSNLGDFRYTRMPTTASASHAYLGAGTFSVLEPFPSIPVGPVFWMLLAIPHNLEMHRPRRYRPECTPPQFFEAISLAIVGT